MCVSLINHVCFSNYNYNLAKSNPSQDYLCCLILLVGLLECHFDERLPYSPIYLMQFLFAQTCPSDDYNLSAYILCFCHPSELIQLMDVAHKRMHSLKLHVL